MKLVGSLLVKGTFHTKVIPPFGLGVSGLMMFRQNVKGELRLFEHRIIRAVISDMWFLDGLESYGVKYAEYFSPVPLATIALVTMMVSS